MNDPASAILEGLTAAGMHWPLVVGILLVLLTGQILLASLLNGIFREKFRGEEYLSLSLAGWLLPASLAALLWYLFARLVSLSFSNLFVGILLLASLVLSIRGKKEFGTSKGVFWSLIVVAGLSILIRLAFVARALLPSYFDSAQHYLYIKMILAHVGSAQNEISFMPGYYHLGFHFLAAFLSYAARAEIAETMLVLGQVILALLPFPVFFIVRHWTGSNMAGFLALALAALGWYMPAHAMDWGKYPALASLALMPFVLAIASLCTKYRNALSREKYLGLLALFLAGAGTSVFLHSRSLVLYLLVAAAGLVTWGWKKLTGWPKLLVLCLFLLVLVGQVVYIQSRGILGPLFDAYVAKGILISAIVLLLTVFAYRAYPSFVFLCVVSTTFLLASLFLPLGNLIPGYANTTPLDRPYVQMVLYLPLALLGGFGLAGLEQFLTGKSVRLGSVHLAWNSTIGVLLIAIVAVHGLLRYELYPSSCCIIVSQDDLTAIQWLDKNLPGGARILTSSTNLNVLPTDKYQGSAGGDSGTWITPLTGRTVALLPYSVDFSQGQTLETLCGQQIGFIYVGKTGWGFNEAALNAQPDKFKLLLDLPRAKIFEVTGCK
jgi:hypothetical protein